MAESTAIATEYGYCRILDQKKDVITVAAETSTEATTKTTLTSAESAEFDVTGAADAAGELDAPGALTYGLVFLCWTFLHSPLALALVATGDGVAFALTYVGVVVIVGRLVPQRLQSTGQTVTQTFGWGVGAIIGPSLGGFVFGRVGAPALFAGAAALCLGGALWVWFVLAGTEHA